MFNCISITGKNSDNFLQNLITNDIKLLKTQQTIYSFLLNPQGRFLYDFWILKNHEQQNSYLLFFYNQNLDEILDKFIFFDIQEEFKIIKENYKLIYEDFISKEKIIQKFIDYRIKNKKLNICLIKRSDLIINFEEFNNYCIQNSILNCNKDFEFNKTLPLKNPATLYAYSFNKGCFIGQEVSIKMYNKIIN